MADKRYRYQYGSEAHAYYESIPAPRQTPEETPRKSKKQVRALDKAFVFQISVCVLSVFVMSLAYLHAYASYNAKEYELKALKTEMRDLKSDISLLQAKISEKMNSDYIKQRASKELGMTLPQTYQIVYIELPQESHTEYVK